MLIEECLFLMTFLISFRLAQKALPISFLEWCYINFLNKKINNSSLMNCLCDCNMFAVRFSHGWAGSAQDYRVVILKRNHINALTVTIGAVWTISIVYVTGKS